MSAKKNALLGENFSTATHKLRKKVMFAAIAALGVNKCYRCEKPIESVEVLSLEHKEPWQSAENPKEMFYDLNNIAFSHLSCNSGAARSHRKRFFSEEEKRLGGAEADKRYRDKHYTKERRHAQYLRTGN